MRKLYVLDCTLRDGGYCNNWEFGEKNVKKIVNGLASAHIDIVECGFLTNRGVYARDVTKYNYIQNINDFLPVDNRNSLYVCMVNYGEYCSEDIPDKNSRSVDGIRVAFHKKDMLSALELCKEIKAKGYKVFIQGMVSLSYSDEEFLDLIRQVNELEPFAFYIVDSFGVMKQKDLIRLFYLVEHNLKKNIAIGYHSHNNMQLAYSNAQALVEIHTDHDIIIDCSVSGMGRGAGNLNTELFVGYLNDNYSASYQLLPLLNIIDGVLNSFYQRNRWGYSLPNYLSAVYNAHPNYAEYLSKKNTLTFESMNGIFLMMNEEKKNSYDEKYIEKLYLEYMEKGSVEEGWIEKARNVLSGKKILVIAPGKSLLDEADKVLYYANAKDVISISVNFKYGGCVVDYIFVSNLRRFREIKPTYYSKCIVTSNIPCEDAYLRADYRELMNGYSVVNDNAGLMLVQLLIKSNVKKILFAGLDGYASDVMQNYMDKDLNYESNRETYKLMNCGMNHVLREYKKLIKMEFVTTPHYINFES